MFLENSNKLDQRQSDLPSSKMSEKGGIKRLSEIINYLMFSAFDRC
jgi:hypothetical protein